VIWVVPWLVGCFYVAPGWQPEPNRPPDIISPEGDLQDIPLLMDRDTRVTVVAQDPEGLPLDFVWIVPVDVEFTWATDSEGDLWYSVLEITADPLLDAQRIEVIVSDSDLEESVSWLVEVP
jgi:hypothetical protein